MDSSQSIPIDVQEVYIKERDQLQKQIDTLTKSRNEFGEVLNEHLVSLNQMTNDVESLKEQNESLKEENKLLKDNIDLLTKALSITDSKHDEILNLLRTLIHLKTPQLISPQAKQMAKQIKDNYFDYIGILSLLKTNWIMIWRNRNIRI